MNQMLSITLPDGSSRAVPLGTTPADIAAAIGPGLAKAALAARVDGELRDLDRPLEHDAQLALVTARDEKDALELVRHDFAHVLAEAVQSLFPGTQITFGPATDDGFYYDFAPKDRAFTEEDLPAIEAEMRRIIAKDEKLVREVWDRDALIDLWKAQGETFKAEWAGELPQGEELTVYRAGTFLDMCRGPHLPSTGKLDPQAFKLTRVSGAYWRGDQKNAMLSRVYGTGWLNKKQLDAHLTRLLAPQGLSHLAPARSLYAPPARCGRLQRGQDAAADGCAPVGAIGPLGQISREYVRRARRGAERGG
jgi:threonyl-tRNA synthetase